MFHLLGTSLLANFYRDVGSGFVSRYGDLGDWSRLSPNDERNVYLDGDVCRVLEDREFLDALTLYGVEFKDRSCAEVNGVLGIQKLFGHRFVDVDVVLLYTKTCNVRIVVYALREVFTRLGFPNVSTVDLRSIAGIDEFDKGLIEVLDKVSAIINGNRDRGCRIYINATPGFKAETAFILFVSLLLGADGAVYVHESFNQPVLIPSIPLSVDVDKLKPLLKIFGEEDSVHINALLSAIAYEKFLEYRDRGLVVIDGEYVRLRPWIKFLVEDMARGG